MVLLAAIRNLESFLAISLGGISGSNFLVVSLSGDFKFYISLVYGYRGLLGILWCLSFNR